MNNTPKLSSQSFRYRPNHISKDTTIQHNSHSIPLLAAILFISIHFSAVSGHIFSSPTFLWLLQTAIVGRPILNFRYTKFGNCPLINLLGNLSTRLRLQHKRTHIFDSITGRTSSLSRFGLLVSGNEVRIEGSFMG